MAINGNRFKKEEVYALSREMKKFMDLLNGITILSRSENDIRNIENQKNKIEEMLLYYEPTILEEYSEETKRAYREMIRAKKEYERVKAEKCYSRVILEAKEYYRIKSLEYENRKAYREKLKKELNKEM